VGQEKKLIWVNLPDMIITWRRSYTENRKTLVALGIELGGHEVLMLSRAVHCDTVDTWQLIVHPIFHRR
jgi:hypothetical protein